MKLKSACRIITAAAVFLLFPSLPAFAAQAVDGNVTTVNGVVSGSVCGNTGGTNTLLGGPNVPLAGDPRDVTNNKVIVESGGAVTSVFPVRVYGGYTEGSGNVTGNIVDVSGYTDHAYGGSAANHASPGDVAGNMVIVRSGGTVDNSAYGGFSTGGAITGNTIVVENGATVGNAFGGFGSGGFGAAGDVTGNKIVVNGAILYEAYSGFTFGNGNVIGNTFDISGSVQLAMGGFAHGAGNVSGNIVTIGGSVLYVYGGYSQGTGDVTGNIVDISGNVQNAYGGYITDNYSAAVADNIVNLHQGASITGGIYGGITYGTGIVSGNTLGVKQFRGSVGEINAFQNYNFELPPGLYAGDTLITITGGTPTDLNGSTIAVSNNFSPGAFSNSGDTITLISQASGSFTTDFPGTAYGGLSKIYSLDLHANSGALVIEATKVSVNPQTKALAQGVISEVLTLRARPAQDVHII